MLYILDEIEFGPADNVVVVCRLHYVNTLKHKFSDTK